MIPYIVLESLKLLGWLVVIFIVIRKRKYLFAAPVMLMLVSSLIMIVSGIEDLCNLQVLHDKSIGWFIGNSFIIWTFLNTVLKYSKQSKSTNETIEGFIKRIEKDAADIKEII